MLGVIWKTIHFVVENVLLYMYLFNTSHLLILNTWVWLKRVPASTENSYSLIAELFTGSIRRGFSFIKILSVGQYGRFQFNTIGRVFIFYKMYLGLEKSETMSQYLSGRLTSTTIEFTLLWNKTDTLSLYTPSYYTRKTNHLGF